MSENKKIKTATIGVISDTHNLLRPEAVKVLENSDLIIHAGDVCRSEILENLRKVAPVVAVRGNNDKGVWAQELPIYKAIEIENTLVYVIHDKKDLKIYPAPIQAKIIITGHSHKPLIKKENDILYLNPGSAGVRRFNLPISVAILKITDDELSAQIIPLLV